MREQVGRPAGLPLLRRRLPRPGVRARAPARRRSAASRPPRRSRSCARCAGSDLAGCDVVEVSPSYDGPGQQTALAAANVALGAARAPRARGSSVIRVCIAGVTGWTGSAVASAVEQADDLELVAGVSRSAAGSDRVYATVVEALAAAPADVVVDYTSAEAVKDNVHAALDAGVARRRRLQRLLPGGLRRDRRPRPRGRRGRDRRRELLPARRAPPPLRDRGGAPRRLVGDPRLRERGKAGRAERHRARARRAARRRCAARS